MSSMRFQVQSVISAGPFMAPGAEAPEDRVSVQLVQLIEDGLPAATLTFNLSREDAKTYFPGDVFVATLTREGSATPAPSEVER